jgi:hypothetical protein
MTTYHVTEREEKMRKFFGTLRKQDRLCDAPGMDELLQLRGISNIEVKNAPVSKRTEEEVWSLAKLLMEEVSKAKGPGYGF